MEPENIKKLLQKYYDAETTLLEEQFLKNYFEGQKISPQLASEQSAFDFYAQEQKIVLPQKNSQQKPSQTKTWLSLAAAAVVILGIGTFVYQQKRINPIIANDSFNDPEIAFRETQKALNLLSQNVNIGIQSVQHIEEFNNSKNMIFQHSFIEKTTLN